MREGSWYGRGAGEQTPCSILLYRYYAGGVWVQIWDMNKKRGGRLCEVHTIHLLGRRGGMTQGRGEYRWISTRGGK